MNERQEGVSQQIDIRPVSGKGALKSFVDYAYQRNAADPNWVPPLRPWTHVAVATSIQGGQLVVNVTCDPQKFTVNSTEEFLRLFVDRLHQTTES